MVTAEILAGLAGGTGTALIAMMIEPFNQSLFDFQINTPARQAAFIAQVAHESAGFTQLHENLNYSAGRLMRAWPMRFPESVVGQYARRPVQIANRAYADRLGNGDEASGDGWRYRGRGLIQITGKANYKKYGEMIGVDLESEPDLAANVGIACRIAGAFWRDKGCNELADAGKFEEITRRINGGLNGIEHREWLWSKAKGLLNVG